MNRIIDYTASYVNSLRSNLSSTHPTDTKNIKAKVKRPLKLHSSDIPYLSILAWFHRKGTNGKCYLTKDQWPEWLVKFGGKAVHYRKQKARWAKLRELGLIETKRFRGNRNKEFDHYITESGLAAVDNFQQLKNENKKTAPRKTKNGPSKVEKSEKTAPPLNLHVQYKDKHDNDNLHKQEKTLERLYKTDFEAAETYKKLIAIGFYHEIVLKVMKKYKRMQIYTAYDLAKEKAKNPGAYMQKILRVLNG